MSYFFATSGGIAAILSTIIATFSLASLPLLILGGVIVSNGGGFVKELWL